MDLLLEMHRTKWIAINAAGILPEYRGRGGDALLFAEMEKTVRSRKFEHAALYQVAETAVDMRRELAHVAGATYKNHRVYTRPV